MQLASVSKLLTCSADTRFFDLPVDALAPSAQPAKLELWLQGGSDLPGNPDHHVRALVNGTFLGEVYWSGTKPQKLDLELWPGVLVEGNNVLELENVGDTFAAYSVVFVDRLALTYPRLAHARGGMLAGTVPYAGTLEVAGVGDAFFFDTTIGVPVLLSHVEDRALRVEAGRRYTVIDRAAVLNPLVTTAAPYVLKRETNQADYILLGPQELLDVAQPLLDQRAAQGLLTWAVPIDTVFEEFGFGEARPEAIKDFLSYAYHHWSAPAPRYVVLLGDGTWDFHDAFGTGASNQVPPLMQKTRYIWASSDSAYAAVNGDDILPDLAIGRLPLLPSTKLTSWSRRSSTTRTATPTSSAMSFSSPTMPTSRETSRPTPTGSLPPRSPDEMSTSSISVSSAPLPPATPFSKASTTAPPSSAISDMAAHYCERSSRRPRD